MAISLKTLPKDTDMTKRNTSYVTRESALNTMNDRIPLSDVVKKIRYIVFTLSRFCSRGREGCKETPSLRLDRFSHMVVTPLLHLSH